MLVVQMLAKIHTCDSFEMICFNNMTHYINDLYLWQTLFLCVYVNIYIDHAKRKDHTFQKYISPLLG